MALNILYIKEKGIYPAYIPKINSNCEKKKNFINEETFQMKKKKNGIILQLISCLHY